MRGCEYPNDIYDKDTEKLSREASSHSYIRGNQSEEHCAGRVQDKSFARRTDHRIQRAYSGHLPY